MPGLSQRSAPRESGGLDRGQAEGVAELGLLALPSELLSDGLDPVWLVLGVVPGVLYCGGAERAVLAEFSQYHGVKA